MLLAAIDERFQRVAGEEVLNLLALLVKSTNADVKVRAGGYLKSDPCFRNLIRYADVC